MVDDTEWVTMGADVKGDIYEGLLEQNAEDARSGTGLEAAIKSVYHHRGS